MRVLVFVCVCLELRLNQIKYLRCRWNCLHDANMSHSKRVLTSLTRTNGSRPLISSVSWFSWILYAWCPRAEKHFFHQNRRWLSCLSQCLAGEFLWLANFSQYRCPHFPPQVFTDLRAIWWCYKLYYFINCLQKIKKFVFFCQMPWDLTWSFIAPQVAFDATVIMEIIAVNSDILYL